MTLTTARLLGIVLVSFSVVQVPMALAVDPAAAPFDDPASIRLEDYLPGSTAGFDESLPKPSSVLGHEVGARFARHDRVVAWFRALAEASPRVEVVDIGVTHEGRPQIVAIISSSGNIRNLTRLQERHVDGEGDAPLFTWHGYSVHGNESSGTQASMAVAWYLAASQEENVKELLRATVVMIDPSLNPDGYGRFSNWGNQASGRVPVAEPANRDRAEPWPGGRTNHYFFDLNRDWLLLQQPESRNRVSFLRRYQPHLMTDHHEMTADNTFFFQPGAETRWNPLIPANNRRLTEALGKFHARALDSAQRLYFSGESFDDFYPGKGSTWPDLQGTVGILFEQAGTRGLVRDTTQGRITLPMSVSNHVLVTLSTLRGAVALNDELKAHRRSFLAGDHVPSGLPAGWVFDDGGDPARAEALLEVIQGQDLDVFGITASVRVGDTTFEPGRAWVVPTLGPRGPLAHALFTSTTKFADTTFYDVSAWSLPDAFGVRAAQLKRMPTSLATDAVVERDHRVRGPRNAVAWVLSWDDYFAPAALYQLQRAGVRARVALEPFTVPSDGVEVDFARGSVIVHAADIPVEDERPGDFLGRVAGDLASLTGVDTGWTKSGPELGSPRVVPLEMPRVALLAGEGINGYAAGSIWHMLDYRLGLPVALIRPAAVTDALLARHTHLIMVDGAYEMDEPTVGVLQRWVNAGGVLVVTRQAALWAQALDWLQIEEGEPGLVVVQSGSAADDVGAAPQLRDGAPQLPDRAPQLPDGSERLLDGSERLPYGSMAAEDGARQIGGAVLSVDLDNTHPVTFGVRLDAVGLLRRGRIELVAPDDNPFAIVGTYLDTPLRNGYLPPGYADEIAGQPAVLAVPRGEGVVIAFADDPAFRAVWWVGERLLSNAIAFGSIIRAPLGDYTQPIGQ